MIQYLKRETNNDGRTGLAIYERSRNPPGLRGIRTPPTDRSVESGRVSNRNLLACGLLAHALRTDDLKLPAPAAAAARLRRARLDAVLVVRAAASVTRLRLLHFPTDQMLATEHWRRAAAAAEAAGQHLQATHERRRGRHLFTP